jgi:hypothetical protein
MSAHKTSAWSEKLKIKQAVCFCFKWDSFLSKGYLGGVKHPACEGHPLNSI